MIFYPSTGSLPIRPQQPRLTQSQKLHFCLPHGSRCPSTWAICWFSQAINCELHWKWSSQDMDWFLHGMPASQLTPLFTALQHQPLIFLFVLFWGSYTFNSHQYTHQHLSSFAFYHLKPSNRCELQFDLYFPND